MGGIAVPTLLSTDAFESWTVVVYQHHELAIEDFATTVAHEVAHLILEEGAVALPVAPGVVALPAPTEEQREAARHNRMALVTLGAATGRLEEVARRDVRAEVTAAALARAWGFGGQEDVERARAVTLDRVVHEAERALVRFRDETVE